MEELNIKKIVTNVISKIDTKVETRLTTILATKKTAGISFKITKTNFHIIAMIIGNPIRTEIKTEFQNRKSFLEAQAKVPLVNILAVVVVKATPTTIIVGMLW